MEKVKNTFNGLSEAAQWPTDSHGNEITWHSLTEAGNRIFERGFRKHQTWYSETVAKAQIQCSLEHIARFQKTVEAASGYVMVISFIPKTGQNDAQKDGDAQR